MRLRFGNETGVMMVFKSIVEGVFDAINGSTSLLENSGFTLPSFENGLQD